MEPKWKDWHVMTVIHRDYAFKENVPNRCVTISSRALFVIESEFDVLAN
jgi:hypothetical protein